MVFLSDPKGGHIVPPNTQAPIKSPALTKQDNPNG